MAPILIRTALGLRNPRPRAEVYDSIQEGAMTLAEQAFAWALVVPKIVEENEAFFMIRSRSLGLRQVRAPCKPRNPEFHL